jgi:Concanavalin A-like lectin/glucanases superfamily
VSRFPLFGAQHVGNDQFTKIMLHCDGVNSGTSFPDDNVGGGAHTWTAHGASTTTASQEFGTASLNAGASAGYIDTPDSADYTLSGDFTFDFWFNRQGGDGTTRFAFGQANSALSSFAVVGGLSGANKLFFEWNTTATAVLGTTVITTTGWHHFAAVRSGTSMLLFLDGTLEASVVTGVAINDSADNFSVGRAGAFASNVWNGFIDEFRLSVGIARWTANFTPPTVPYF